MARLSLWTMVCAGAFVLAIAACGGEDPSAPSSTVSDTGAPTTTVAFVPSTAAPSAVDALCTVLEAAPYERRKAALDETSAAGEAATRCSDSLATTEAAVRVDAAARSLEDKDIADLDSQLTCSGDNFTWTVTNSFDVAIGLYGIGELYRPVDGEDDDRLGSPDASVLWRLEPGETATLDGSFPLHEQDLDRCSIAGWFFVADGDDLSGDAAVASAGGDVGDDPAVWLPILYQRQRMYDVTGDPELVETFEDLRSMAYSRLVSDGGNASEFEPTEDLPPIEVCGKVGDIGTGATGLVYQVGPEVDADSYLVFGVFRRGAGGMWRWLGSSVRWTSPNLTTCEEWTAATGS